MTVLKMAHQKGMANLEILQAQGSLEKRLQPLNISVEWSEFSSTSPLLEAMSVGLDFGGGGRTGSVFAQASDKSFVRVAEERSTSTRGQAILVLEKSPIKTLADLKGKKVAFAKGSSSHYVIVQALKKANLQLSDIQPVYLPPSDALPAFERGDIDAWAIWNPNTAQTEKTVRTRMLADLSAIFGEKASGENPAFYYAAPNFVHDHPDLLKLVLEEVNKAGAWAKSNVKASAKLLASRYKIDLSTMETVQQRSGDRRIEPVSDRVLSGLQQMADTFVEQKIIPKQIDVRDKKYNWISSQNW